MAKKKVAEKAEEPKAPKIKRVFKPEKCPSHKFIVESDGRVDMLASHEVTDDSICFNCGLYFSTWAWYSDKINASFWDGVDNEAGQTINYVAQKLAKQDDRLVSDWGELLLDKLRERRKKNGKRRYAKLDDGPDGGDLREAGSSKDANKDGD
jgi:hypothetical protein